MTTQPINLPLVLKWCIFTPNENPMTRKTISISAPNEAWIQDQLAKEEYASNSELINDLIRKARAEEAQNALIRQQWMLAEQSGTSEFTPEQIRKQIRRRMNMND